MINTNVGALNARVGCYSYQQNGAGHGAPVFRLTINSAADDAAGLAVAGKMKSSYAACMSIRNAQDGVGLIQTGNRAQ